MRDLMDKWIYEAVKRHERKLRFKDTFSKEVIAAYGATKFTINDKK